MVASLSAAAAVSSMLAAPKTAQPSASAAFKQRMADESEQRLEDMRKAVEALRQLKKTPRQLEEERKARAQERVAQIKKRLEMLKQMARMIASSGNKKAAANLAAELKALAKELSGLSGQLGTSSGGLAAGNTAEAGTVAAAGNVTVETQGLAGANPSVDPGTEDGSGEGGVAEPESAADSVEDQIKADAEKNMAALKLGSDVQDEIRKLKEKIEALLQKMERVERTQNPERQKTVAVFEIALEATGSSLDIEA
jgi:archaellum component FlaC